MIKELNDVHVFLSNAFCKYQDAVVVCFLVVIAGIWTYFKYIKSNDKYHRVNAEEMGLFD